MRTKTITTGREYENALARIEKLMDDAKPDTPQGNELERLVRSVEDYEDQVYPVPKPTRTKMLAAATVRGFKVVKELQKAEDGAWSGAALRKRFGLGLADLRRRRKEQKIVYWQASQRTIFYPKWQFTPTGGLLPGVEELLHLFHSHEQWRVMSYFLSPRLQLGDTVFRWFAGLDSTLELRVTAVTRDRIVCGPWEFDRQTGAEIDEDLGWGPTLPGSYIRTTPVSAEDN